MENLKTIPKKITTILESFDDNKDLYKECKRLLAEMEPLSYTFDYGLDGEPYNLRKINIMKNMTEEQIYGIIKKKITRGIYNYNDQILAITKWIKSEFTPKT